MTEASSTEDEGRWACTLYGAPLTPLLYPQRDLHQVKQGDSPPVNQNTGLSSNEGISRELYKAQPLRLSSSLTRLL